MPTPTYDLIASNVLTSSAASVTFSSIPATYRDLVLVSSNLGVLAIRFRFNSDSGSNYSSVIANGDGSTTTSLTDTGTYLRLFWGSVNQLWITQFLDYSATDKHKTILSRQNQASSGTEMAAGRWASTSALNSISIDSAYGNLGAGASFYLYGIVS